MIVLTHFLNESILETRFFCVLILRILFIMCTEPSLQKVKLPQSIFRVVLKTANFWSLEPTAFCRTELRSSFGFICFPCLNWPFNDHPRGVSTTNGLLLFRVLYSIDLIILKLSTNFSLDFGVQNILAWHNWYLRKFFCRLYNRISWTEPKQWTFSCFRLLVVHQRDFFCDVYWTVSSSQYGFAVIFFAVIAVFGDLSSSITADQVSLNAQVVNDLPV